MVSISEKYLHLSLSESVFVGFTVSLFEYEATIPTLWNAVSGQFVSSVSLLKFKPSLLEFIQKNPTLVSPDNAMSFLSDDGGHTYNRCHCKSSLTLELTDIAHGRTLLSLE